MKRLLFTIFIVLPCFVLNVQLFSQNETRQWNNVINESLASENQNILTDVSDIYNYPANKEDYQPTLQRLFPTFNKSSFIGALFYEKAGIVQKREISTYIFFIDCHISRLEGTDIIHPFHYFW